ncbi:MAG TPA: hypothetical protein VIX59_02490 [Candidatus Binataceae bacterium]
MLVVEIDHFHAEPLEARFAGTAHILRLAVDRTRRRIRRTNDPEFGRQHDFVAAAADRAPHQFLVGVRTVGVGGVEKVDPEIECPMDRRERFRVVVRTIEGGHAHASQPNLRYLDLAASKFSEFHLNTPS